MPRTKKTSNVMKNYKRITNRFHDQNSRVLKLCDTTQHTKKKNNPIKKWAKDLNR